VERIVRGASRVIVLSPALAPMLDGLIEPRRVVAVDNGVDPALAAAGAAAARARPAGAGITALFLSNWMEQKGYVSFLEAARLDAQRGARHRFVLAGAKTDTSTVDPEAFVREHGLGNVRIEGPVRGDRKHAVLGEADAFVLPTRYPVEGQPIAILEALHFGLPVITTRAGGIADVIREETNGLFVGPNDARAVLAALDRLADGPELRARIDANNRALAVARFTAQAHGEAMLRVFADVARERSAR
jgi:glycosyltransferase involved in cell wall biosynthesis